MLFVYWGYCLHRFQFHDDQIGDNQIGPKTFFQADIFINYWKWLLTFSPEASFSKLKGESCLIYRFKQAWAKGGVDLVGAVDDYLGQFILGPIYLTQSPDSSAHAKAPRAQRVRVRFSKPIKILKG